MPQTDSLTEFSPLSPYALLTQDAMSALDTLVIQQGTDGLTLMRRAGAAVVSVIESAFPSPASVLVLCGLGKNGGDGFIVAGLLQQKGWTVTCTVIGDVAQLSGPALQARADYPGSLVAWSPDLLGGCTLIVDALFGIGLNRPLSAEYEVVIQAVNECRQPVVSIDMPSGIHADTGAALGQAICAKTTVTFTRKKPGLLLLPGRIHAGEVIVADIGIEARVVATAITSCAENHPALWQDQVPRFGVEQHKYHHGHALVLGGGVMTGAARLAARAAQRSGAGLVTVAAPPYATLVYASNLDSVLVHPVTTIEDWCRQVEDPRKNAILLGPGAGVSELLQAQVLAALATGKPVLLDADALTAFSAQPEKLFRALHAQTVLTPHAGEFERLFGPQREFSDKLSLVARMARLVQCVVLLKGADTVIAAPDGRAVINTNAPPWLATAGSGDVLAGILTGFLAQGVEAFTAACIAVWLHGAAAHDFSPGMIAEDLVTALPNSLAKLRV